MNGVKKGMLNYIEKWCIRKCDYIIMPEKNRIAYFIKKHKNIPKILLLQNFPRKSELSIEKEDIFRKIYPISKEQKIVLYTGKIAPERYIEELIDSLSICSDDFALVILGRSSKEYEAILREQIQQRYLTGRVFLHDPVPHAEIMRYMAACDIGTAFYRNTNLNSFYCASNKLYEYIALDKAVVTNNYPGLLETVEHFRQGVCLADVTPRSLAESYMRASNPVYVTPGVRKFFWEDEQDVLTQLYEK
jgi:glycosyltransferase involved in cell wall biosynthesis